MRGIRVYAERMGAGLYHYQDYLNREIDVVVELLDGDWAALGPAPVNVLYCLT